MIKPPSIWHLFSLVARNIMMKNNYEKNLHNDLDRHAKYTFKVPYKVQFPCQLDARGFL